MHTFLSERLVERNPHPLSCDLIFLDFDFPIKDCIKDEFWNIFEILVNLEARSEFFFPLFATKNC